jgi:hypothetical protein
MRWIAVMLEAARHLLGTPYALGGREAGKGVDCQGVVFLAAQAVKPCSWKSYSVFPTKTVALKELGEPVPGLSPVSRETLDVTQLEPGDVVMLLNAVENIKEPAIAQLDGKDVWVWHMGLYSVDGKWIDADPFTGQVQEHPLTDFLSQHNYAGIFVTRMKHGPHPSRCR